MQYLLIDLDQSVIEILIFFLHILVLEFSINFIL